MNNEISAFFTSWDLSRFVAQFQHEIRYNSFVSFCSIACTLENQFSPLLEQSDPPYRVGKIKDLNKNKYRASLFIDLVNKDPKEEMSKTHEFVVRSTGDILAR